MKKGQIKEGRSYVGCRGAEDVRHVKRITLDGYVHFDCGETVKLTSFARWAHSEASPSGKRVATILQSDLKRMIECYGLDGRRTLSDTAMFTEIKMLERRALK